MACPTADRVNEDVAARLDEVALLLAAQRASPFRVRAYRRAADTLRTLPHPVSDVLAREGLPGLERLPGIGESIARTVRDLLTRGRSAMLDRMRGESDPIRVLASVPGIGRVTADRLHHELGLETLEDLEAAAHDRRLADAGIGAKRLAGIRDSLAHRLERIHEPAAHESETVEPPLDEILDVDREYRERAKAGELVTITPRRFNRARLKWLPILHTERGGRHYTALFSNTARAHSLGKTTDWVVVYCDGRGGERRCTVITAEYGPLRGQRIVRGREGECASRHRAARRPSAA